MGITAAIIGGATSAAAIAQGRKAEQAQKEAMARQEQAQAFAKAQTAAQQKSSDMAMNKANQATPDMARIMGGAMEASKRGVASTLLTGTSGVDTAALELGRSTLLGQ